MPSDADKYRDKEGYVGRVGQLGYTVGTSECRVLSFVLRKELDLCVVATEGCEAAQALEVPSTRIYRRRHAPGRRDDRPALTLRHQNVHTTHTDARTHTYTHTLHFSGGW